MAEQSEDSVPAAERVVKKITEKHHHDNPSSLDFDDGKSSSLKSKIYRIFGRERPAHEVLGGGKRMKFTETSLIRCSSSTSLTLMGSASNKEQGDFESISISILETQMNEDVVQSDVNPSFAPPNSPNRRNESSTRLNSPNRIFSQVREFSTELGTEFAILSISGGGLYGFMAGDFKMKDHTHTQAMLFKIFIIVTIVTIISAVIVPLLLCLRPPITNFHKLVRLHEITFIAKAWISKNIPI